MQIDYWILPENICHASKEYAFEPESIPQKMKLSTYFATENELNQNEDDNKFDMNDANGNDERYRPCEALQFS